MKLTAILALLFVLLGVGRVLQAGPTTTFVRIVGSPAFRATAQQAALDYVNSISYPTTGQATFCYTGDSGLQQATAANFRAVYDNRGDNVVIQTNFTGSIAGLIAIANYTSKSFGTLAFINSSSVGTVNGLAGATVNPANLQPSDLCFSDVFYQTVQPPLTISNPAPNFRTITSASPLDLRKGTLCVLPFEFVSSGNTLTSGATLTNLNLDQAKSVLHNGITGVKGSVFTGNSVDAADSIYTVGYDSGSGERIITLADIGLAGYGMVNQNLITYSISSIAVTSPGSGYTTSDSIFFSDGSLNNGTFTTPLTAGTGAMATLSVDANGSITGVNLSNGGTGYINPTATIQSSTGSGAKLQLNLQVQSHTAYPGFTSSFNGLTYQAGTQGYNNVPSILNAVTVAPEAPTSHYIAYLGAADASYAVAHGASPLTFEGVPYSTVKVQNGQYAYWTYEHLYVTNLISSALALSVINNYTKKVLSDLSYSQAIPLSTMHVSRLADGPNLTADGGSIQ